MINIFYLVADIIGDIWIFFGEFREDLRHTVCLHSHDITHKQWEDRELPHCLRCAFLVFLAERYVMETCFVTPAISYFTSEWTIKFMKVNCQVPTERLKIIFSWNLCVFDAFNASAASRKSNPIEKPKVFGKCASKYALLSFFFKNARADSYTSLSSRPGSICSRQCVCRLINSA